MSEADLNDDVVVYEDQGTRKAILGYTWPGIEFGEPPTPTYTFFEYVDVVRRGTIEEFEKIQNLTKEWWFPTLDRGAGSLIHFAVDHGRLDMVTYLVETLQVPVNQQALNGLWTPLHRCARLIHYKHAPFFDIFEFLLQHGADPMLQTADDDEDCPPCTAFDLVVKKGYQWEEGEVRSRVQTLIDAYKDILKVPPYTYQGPPHGDIAENVMRAWRSLPALYPPKNWSGPVPPGYQVPQGSYQGMRSCKECPWVPAGKNDGTKFTEV